MASLGRRNIPKEQEPRSYIEWRAGTPEYPLPKAKDYWTSVCPIEVAVINPEAVPQYKEHSIQNKYYKDLGTLAGILAGNLHQ